MNETKIDGYPKNPLIEVTIVGKVHLMSEIEIQHFIAFGELQRKRYSKRFEECRKQSKDVATLDGKYLSWVEYRQIKDAR